MWSSARPSLTTVAPWPLTASKPNAPGVNSVTVGGADGSRLLFPVLPGSDLNAALGG